MTDPRHADFNSAQLVISEMIELDLQQAWELLAGGNFDGAIHHFRQAIAKTDEMRKAGQDQPAKPETKQLTIDIP